MEQLERKMYMPDCDNPSGKYPSPKHVCDDCGEKTVTGYNLAGACLCAKCRRHMEAGHLEWAERELLKMESEETDARLKRIWGKAALIARERFSVNPPNVES